MTRRSARPPRACGGSPHQVGERHTDRIREADQIVEDRRLMALLDPVHGLPVQPCQFGEPLLAEVRAQAGGAYLLTDGPAADEDPVGGRGGWHPTTLSGS